MRTLTRVQTNRGPSNQTAKRWAMVHGVGSGVATNPLAMVPAAMADMGSPRARKLTSSVLSRSWKAPSSGDHIESFHTDILAVMLPNAVSQALREVGVQAGKATTRTLIRKYIGGNLLKAIITFAAKYLGIKLTQRVRSFENGSSSRCGYRCDTSGIGSTSSVVGAEQ
ncbi:MAG: hypothetical protein R3A52_06820 [Polyangiales bacterium]